MMISKLTLVSVADRFRAASGDMPETTLSYRIFGDSKKLTALRGEADITVGRFNAAMRWMAQNWPDGADRPGDLTPYAAAASAASAEDAA